MTDTAASMPDQRSLFEQVSDLWRFARQQKMYDAQDWLILDEVLGDGTNYAVQRGILADFEARTAIRPRTTTAIRDGSPGLQIITEVHLTWDEFVSLVSRDA